MVQWMEEGGAVQFRKVLARTRIYNREVLIQHHHGQDGQAWQVSATIRRGNENRPGVVTDTSNINVIRSVNSLDFFLEQTTYYFTI